MREKLFLVLTAWAALLAGYIPAMFSESYLSFSEPLWAAVMGGMLASLVLATPALVAALFFRSISATRVVVGMITTYAVYKIVRGLMPPFQLDWTSKVALVCFTIAMTLGAIRYIGPSGWRKGTQVVLAGVCIWALSPFLISWIGTANREETNPTLSVERIFDRNPRAVVVLVLDETSPEVMSLLSATLKSDTHSLHAATILRAGKDTINAIPSMLTPHRHDGARPCGRTRLCGSTFFEMDRLEATQPNTDVVGFYHPYCAIRGLRSCFRANAEDPESPAADTSLVLSLGSRLPRIGGGGLMLERDELSKATYEHVRKSVAEHALRAPFWSQGGGLLYIHQLLPHPTGVGPRRRLAREYQANIREAAMLVEALSHRLQAEFQADFALIVTADHPLRTAMWCASPVYASPECPKENPVERDWVPFLVWAPKGMTVKMPTTNVGIFSPSPT